MTSDERLETIRKIIDGTPWITVEALLARHLESHLAAPDPVSDWKRRGLIFSVEIGSTEYFARYQFDGMGRPLPVIREILEALGPVGDPWKIAAWFYFPNGWLVDPNCTGGTPRAVAPKDALQRPVLVIEAARNSRETYWA
jgi:hypothetical protein